MRMVGKMAAGGDAFADDVDKFNRTMNLGHQLATWFTGAFGSTLCRGITGCDFSTTAGVNQYIDMDGVTRCQALARQVAQSGAHDRLSGLASDRDQWRQDGVIRCLIQY
jgi:hypothetical protein